MLPPTSITAAGLLASFLLLALAPSQALAASVGAVSIPFLDLDPLGASLSENRTLPALERRATSDVSCTNNDQCQFMDRPDVPFSTGFCDIRLKKCAWDCFRGYTYWEITNVCARGRAPRMKATRGPRPGPSTSAEQSTSTSEATTTAEPPAPSTTSTEEEEPTTSAAEPTSTAVTPPAPETPSGRACSLTVDCAGTTIPPSANRWCDVANGLCSWRCQSGFVSTGDACVRGVAPQASTSATQTPTATSSAEEQMPTPAPVEPTPVPTTEAPATTITSTSTTSSAAPTQPSNPYLVDADLSQISAFKANTGGWNTNSLVSWFRTNNAADDTNGNSWCYRPYSDDTPGFAPSLNTMLGAFNWNPLKAGKSWCGLEAEFTTPDGRTAMLYIADAFDDKWVRTPNAVDVVINSFPLLFGRWTSNKNDVVQNAQWRLTGKRDTRYLFNNGQAAWGIPFDQL